MPCLPHLFSWLSTCLMSTKNREAAWSLDPVSTAYSCCGSGGRPQTVKEFWKCVENTTLLRWNDAVPVGLLPLTPWLKGLGRNRLWVLPLMLFCLKGVIPAGSQERRRTVNENRYSQKFADLRRIPKPSFSIQECHQQRGWAEGGCSGGTPHSNGTHSTSGRKALNEDVFFVP